MDDIDKLLAEAGLGGGGDAPKTPDKPKPEENPASTGGGGMSDVDAVLAQLNAGLGGEAPPPGPATPPAKAKSNAAAGAAKASFPSFDSAPSSVATSPGDISLLENVNVRIQVLLGRAVLTVDEILKLASGSVVELDKLAGEPLDILVNDKLVAKGEVLVLNENFCIRVTEIIPPEERA